MKIYIPTRAHKICLQKGFASILIVISVGLALLVTLLMAYKNTITSQKDQSNHLLRNDYHQREDAFLRALTNIIPNQTMRGMMDNSTPTTWSSIMQEALVQSNAHQAMESATITSLGLSSKRSSNTADTTISAANVVHSVFSDGGLISSGTNSAAGYSTYYPDLLSCSAALKTEDANRPIVSYLKQTGSGSEYEKILAPQLDFKYQENPDFIAKHNWWTFQASFAEQDTATTQFTKKTKRYLISLYEVPAQLAINSASFTNFGQHDNGSDWTNITTTGGVFAGGVKAKGSFTSSGGIASRRGVELADASNPLASDNSARNDALYNGGTDSSYSSSSDGGHVAFVPVLPVLPVDLYNTAGNQTDSDYLLYTQYLSDMKTWTSAGSEPTTRPINNLFYTRSLPVRDEKIRNTSATNNIATPWKYYSRGANQCDMILIDDGTTDSFSYISNGVLTNLGARDTIKVGDELVFPIDAASLVVDVAHLIAYLEDNNIDMSVVNSLCVNTDKTVILENAKDFTSDRSDSSITFPTAFINGFSIVTNQLLVLSEDTNVGYDSSYTPPPLSIYAPLARYGKVSNGTLKIEVTGALGSLAEKSKDDAVNIADLKVLNETTSGAAIKATLTSITELSDLPPINMMNWMIVIREIQQ